MTDWKDALESIFGSNHQPATAEQHETIGGDTIEPMNVHIDSDELEWLFRMLNSSDDSYMYAREIRLQTNRGELVVTSDEIKVEWEREDDSQSTLGENND